MKTENNYTALITGAGSGIGKSIALQLADAGYKIIAVSRNEHHLNEISSALNNAKHITLQADLISDAGCEKLLACLQQNGMPHIVVCNLNSNPPRKKLQQLAAGIQEKSITENIKHLFCIMPEVIQFQRNQQYGRWIGISSMSPHLGVPGMSVYNMQKGVLENCLRTLASEEGKNNITANIIAPGLIATPTVLQNYIPEEMEKRKKENVMHKIGSPDDIAAAVNFLASPQAGFITGITLPVNGGNHLAWQYIN
ncbi:MAG: SDR family oxidoreductase [Chitinophagales bacterium]|nr:SDR family oxidoreductase [Bacteroidota bacterium]